MSQVRFLEAEPEMIYYRNALGKGKLPSKEDLVSAAFTFSLIPWGALACESYRKVGSSFEEKEQTFCIPFSTSHGL